ncbi:MAG TPA: PIG-L family deacetylase [Nitrospirae bacterium]|nr:PIG-L family deacetylase [Nitrospirota bacterium]
MLLEQEIIPYNISNPIGNKVLVLAPHPDDETLGCGGTLTQLIESGNCIKVLFLTSGDKSDPDNQSNHIKYDLPHITDYSIMREDEAKKALKILSINDYLFMRQPDRELHFYYKSVETILKIEIEKYKPDTIYSPSPLELNPDHRTCAKLIIELQREIKDFKIAFYEVTTPLRPNLLVDVTRYFDRKILALREYKSQLGLIDYSYYISALNKFRAITVGTAYCESYWIINHPISDEDICNWLCYRTKLI